MKQFLTYGLLAVMLVLAGCPVQTKNSIDNGSYSVPAWMYGTWRKSGSSSKTSYLLEKDERKGYLKRYSVDSTGKVGKEAQPVVMSTIGDKIFLSVFTPADDMDQQGYYLYEFRKVGNKEFMLVPLKEKSIDYNATSEEIKRYIQERLNSTELYDLGDMETYVKQ
jgi:hypothetical protein